MSLTVIYGRRRQGKSTLALSLSLTSGKPVLIYDPNEQYRNIPQLDWETLEDWLEIAGEGDIARIVPEDPATDWEILAGILDGGVWEFSDYCLILDEVSVLQRVNSIDPLLERFIRQSPKDIELVLTTHRSVDTHNLIRSLAHHVFIFQTYLKRDLQYLRDNYGENFAHSVERLGDYQVAHWWLDKGGKVRYTIWEDPTIWYVDIGRTT